MLEEREADPLVNRSAAKPDELKDNHYDNYKSNLYGELNKSMEGQSDCTGKGSEPQAAYDTQHFLTFVRVYLKYERSLEQLRMLLSSKDDLDMMKLFKRFDRHTRGVINS